MCDGEQGWGAPVARPEKARRQWLLDLLGEAALDPGDFCEASSAEILDAIKDEMAYDDGWTEDSDTGYSP
jgi:hypothetical protein